MCIRDSVWVVLMFSGAKFLSLSENAVLEEVTDMGEVVEEDVEEGVDGVKVGKGEIVQVEKCEVYNSCRTCKVKVVGDKLLSAPVMTFTINRKDIVCAVGTVV